MRMGSHDRVLTARVREYVENTDGGPVDILAITKYLQNRYREYGRRKRAAFATAVRLVYEAIVERREEESHGGEMNMRLRRKTRKRRRSPSSDSADSASIISTYSSEEGGVSRTSKSKGSNLMNSSLTTLYRRGQPAESITRTDQSIPYIDQSIPVVSDNGFVIDRNPSNDLSKVQEKEKENVSHSKKKKSGVTRKKDRSEIEKDVTVLETSTVTFQDVGGLESELLELSMLLLLLERPEICEILGDEPPQGILLHGPPGTGKTLLAHAIAGELGLPFIKLAATELISGISGDSEKKIRDLFSQALAFSPCVLFLDEIHALAPQRDTAQREMECRIVAQFASCLDEIRSTGKRIILIGATSKPQSLDPTLKRRFDKQFPLGIPNERTRTQILRVLCERRRLEPNFDYSRLSRLCPGYVGADLVALAREATVSASYRMITSFSQTAQATQENGNRLIMVKNQIDELRQWRKGSVPFNEQHLEELYVTMADFEAALDKVTPSTKQEGFATVPDTTWKDVGALANVRDELKWAILYPIQHADKLESLRLESKPQGILLCGPPGCGKTLLAKAISNERAMNFISVKGPELLNMYVGESERAVREVFQKAKNSAPCLIFFDEVDSLCPSRSSYDTGGVSARVVNTLLCELDGLESRRQVFIMGATNRPDMIDPAVLRPGRLEKIIYVGFPSLDDRVDILNALTREGRPKLDSDVDLASVAADTRADFFTGADLSALVREASTSAWKEWMYRNETGQAADAPIIVSMRHFEQAFDRVKPSVQPKERQRYLELEKKYGYSASVVDKMAIGRTSDFI